MVKGKRNQNDIIHLPLLYYYLSTIFKSYFNYLKRYHFYY
jgi:hypothetical protein